MWCNPEQNPSDSGAPAAYERRWARQYCSELVDVGSWVVVVAAGVGFENTWCDLIFFTLMSLQIPCSCGLKRAPRVQPLVTQAFFLQIL